MILEDIHGRTDNTVHHLSSSSHTSTEDASSTSGAPQVSRRFLDRKLMLLLLSFLVALGINIYFWQDSAESTPAIPPLAEDAVQQIQFPDTDGDGVPDHHDSCPRSSVCVGSDCVPRWSSGSTTDFDGDGCEDGIEDSDKDNDGVPDLHDECPYTPQEYAFVSNLASDFDGDGCADGLEDHDDDNDKIPNIIDICPLTASGAQPDSNGCSELQRSLREKIGSQLGQARLQMFRQQPQQQDINLEEDIKVMPTRLESWINTVLGSLTEVIVGAILTPLMEHIWECKGSGLSILKHQGLRIAVYVLVVLWLRMNRCNFQDASSWFTTGVEAIVGSCPAAV